MFSLNAAFADEHPAPTDKKIFIGQEEGDQRIVDEAKGIGRSDSAVQEHVLVTFNQYTTIEEAASIINPNDVLVDEIFISLPNETGRTIIVAKGAADLDQAIENEMNFMIQNHEENGDSDICEILEDIKNNYKVFAVSYLGAPSVGDQVAESSLVRSIETFGNPEAERTALLTNQSIQYIALPQKPDGTH